MNIYNIQQQYLEIAEELQENGGELTEELELALAINKEELEVKAANYGYVIKSVIDSNISIDKEIERLDALKKANTNTIDRLKHVVHSAMDMFGVTEIKLNNIKINFRASTVVLIENEDLIPKKYRDKKPATFSISKKRIGDALKLKTRVRGASLDHKKTLQVK